MKANLTALAALLAMAFATNAGAQPQNIEQQYKAMEKKCDGLKDNAKEICEAEAEGFKRTAEAQAKMSARDTPKTRLEYQEAKAEADYKVAKARCGDQVGDAKKACENEAKAMQDLAKAQAKRQSLAQMPSDGSTSSGSSGPAAPQPPAAASGAPAAAQAAPAAQPAPATQPAPAAQPASPASSTPSAPPMEQPKDAAGQPKP